MNNKHKWTMAAFLAFAFVACASGRASADGTLIGRYCGSLESNGRLVPAETDLFTDGRGGLSGRYHFDDDGQTYEGVFLNGKLRSSGEWLLQWKDAFGVGTLDIGFNSDASRFDGSWGADKQKPSHAWNGKLCEAAATS